MSGIDEPARSAYVAPDVEAPRLVNMADHESVHRIRTEYFGGAPPASTSVEISQLFDHRQLVEMEFTAVVPQVHSNLF